MGQLIERFNFYDTILILWRNKTLAFTMPPVAAPLVAAPIADR